MLKPVLGFVAVYLFLLGVACAVVRAVVSLHPATKGEIIASVWSGGELLERVVLADANARDARLDQALAATGSELVLETVVADGPILTWPDLAFGISLVPGRDGLRVTTEGGQTSYVTPDDLLARQIYDHGLRIETLTIALGVDTGAVKTMLAHLLSAKGESDLAQADLRRIRVERKRGDERPRITADTLRREDVREAVIAGARYVARGVSPEGRFRHTVSAPKNQTLPSYDWPRHAGTTFFLAQTAAMTKDPALAEACRRAASLMSGSALSSCGGLPCVGNETVVGLGSSALALLAFAEVVEKGIDQSHRPIVVGLSRFLRAQQRPDGEFQHYYDREIGQPIDRQVLYYSSEATLALARAYAITGDAADLDAAVRGLRHLVGPAWSFFGDRYYFSEEHWTCQAMGALWAHAPNPQALDFCLRWQEFGRAIQQSEGDSYFDADGSIGVGPVVTPRLTPVASRCEAAVATIDVARQSGVSSEEMALLDRQLRRALALLVRQQFRPGPRHLFQSPEDVEGAMPGSEVDWELRIDYTQHAGSAMVRWLELFAGDPSRAPGP